MRKGIFNLPHFSGYKPQFFFLICVPCDLFLGRCDLYTKNYSIWLLIYCFCLVYFLTVCLYLQYNCSTLQALSTLDYMTLQSEAVDFCLRLKGQRYKIKGRWDHVFVSGSQFYFKIIQITGILILVFVFSFNLGCKIDADVFNILTAYTLK